MNTRRAKRLARTQPMFERGHSYHSHSERFFGRMYNRFSDDILAQGISPGAMVLDAGCGPGMLILRLAQSRTDLSLHGADLATGMIEEATESAAHAGLQDRVRFVQADLADLPYEEGTFDLVVSSLSMHHWQDIRGVLNGLARVIKPGGAIRIYDASRLVPAKELLATAAEVFPDARVSRTYLKRHRFSIPLLQRFDIDQAS